MAMKNKPPSVPHIQAPKWVDVLAPTVRAARIRGTILIVLIGILVLGGVVAPSKPIPAFVVLAVICGALYVAVQMAQFVRMRINVQMRILLQQEREKKGKG
ncbi:MAG: hypothetical protein FJ039_11925 [Chloroflexi bacterium]|nr:hypothetical protein [Chloroflexota bacterium]